MRLVLCMLMFGVVAGAARSQSALDAILDRRPHAWWGALVVDTSTDSVIYARNAERSFVPASVTKLFTTAAALEQLGVDYRYETQLVARGVVRDSTLYGDLIVVGSGDPSTGEPGNDPDAFLIAWADSLLAHGIRRIEGDLLGNDEVFDDVPLGADWSWDDAVYAYAAPISGLTYHDAAIRIAVIPTVPGELAAVSWTPLESLYMEVINHSVTLESGRAVQEVYRRRLGTNQIVVASEVPVGSAEVEWVSIDDPTLFFLHAFRGALEARGIAVAGDLRHHHDRPVHVDSGPEHVLARTWSKPVSELVYTTNKESHNLYAEHLLRTLGAELAAPEGAAEAGSAAMGVRVAMVTLGAAGVDTSRIQLVDGSGLSRRNLVSPAMTVELLQYMDRHAVAEVRDAFVRSLPVGGVDGTLEHRFTRRGSAGQRVQAKTGTLGNVSGLAGYVTARSGRRLAFALFCNHFQGRSSAVRAIQDAFAARLVDL